MPNEDFRNVLKKLIAEVLTEEKHAKEPGSSQVRPQNSIASNGYGSADPTEARDLPERLIGAPQPERPRADQVAILPNARVTLSKGKLLLGVQKDNSVHVFDPKTGEFEIYCRFEGTPMLLWRAVPAPNGRIYVAMSGTRWPGHPTEVAFGQGGAIFLVDNKEEEMKVIPGSELLMDPGELIVQNDKIVVVDFMGFGGTGAIYRIDPSTGDRTVLYEGEPLKEPVALASFPNGDFLIANSFMRYAPVIGPSGRKLKEMGALLKLKAGTSELTAVHDESSAPKGVIDSVAIDDEDSRFILYTRNDWPLQETGGLFAMNLETGEQKTIQEARDGVTLFARISPSMDGVAAVADSYNKSLYTVDIKSAKIVDRWSLAPVLGPGRGMVTPLETVESLRWT